MKVTISAIDKPNQKTFTYQLKLSDSLASTLVICATVIICTAISKKK